MVFAPWSCHRTRLSAPDLFARPSATSFTLTKGERRFLSPAPPLTRFSEGVVVWSLEPSRRATRGASPGHVLCLGSECRPRRWHCAWCFKEETDANAPKDRWNPDIPCDRVPRSRLRAGDADGGTAYAFRGGPVQPAGKLGGG